MMNGNSSAISGHDGSVDVDQYDLVYEVSLGISHFPFLGDHRIQGAVVVPGAAFLEMGFAAAIEVYGAQSCCLGNVEFHEALFLPEQGQRSMRLQICDSADQYANFRVISVPEGMGFDTEEFTVHVTGLMQGKSLDASTAVAEEQSMVEVLASCTEHLSGEEHVEGLRDKGFGFGPAFQQVRKMWCGEQVALGEIALPDHLHAEAGSYYFHPALLDACLQVCAGALPEKLRNHAYLPVGVERFELFQTPPARLWSHVVLQNNSGTESNSLNANIRVLDDTGELIAEIVGLKIQRFDRVAPCAVREGLANYLYDLDWVKLSKAGRIMRNPIDAQVGSRWILFGASGQAGLRLSSELENRGQTCILVAPGDGFTKISDQHYRIWAGNKQHYERLFEELGMSSSERYNVLYLSDFAEIGDGIDDPAESIPSIPDRCFSLLTLVQSLVSRGTSLESRLWLVTSGGCSVEESDQVNLADAALSGLSRVIAQEYPRLWGGALDLAGKECEGDEKLLIDEVLHPDGGPRVAFRSGDRYVQRLVCDDDTHQKETAFRARADRTYLISGGLGGVGLEIASWLVKQGARHLALTSRRQLPERAVWSELSDTSDEYHRTSAVSALERLGAKVYLPVTDVSDSRQVRSMFARLAGEAPPICGIIHAAGVIKDHPLAEMDYPSLAAVMDAKVAGAWSLHEQSLGLDLDFFVLFSSISAVLGTPGQGNYAAANAFMDALAVFRRRSGVPALSINWGPWDAIGMTAGMDQSSFTRLGLQPLKQEQGCQALGMLLGKEGAPPQKVVAGFDWHLFRQSELERGLQPLLDGLADPESDTVTIDRPAVVGIRPEPASPAPMQASGFRSLDDITAYLKRQVSTVLGLDGSQSIDPSEPLLNYGFESLMAVRLRNMLENDLKQTLPATLVFDYPTLGDLAAYIESKIPGQAREALEHPIDEESQAAMLRMLEEVEQSADGRVASDPL